MIYRNRKLGLLIVVANVILAVQQVTSTELVLQALGDFFLEHLQTMMGQKSHSSFTGHEMFKDYAMIDESNEEISSSTSQKIIRRSGFYYEDYYSVSDDGYATELIRIVNPLADRSKLKQPPVMLHHGGNVDPTMYIWASAIQHHPEPWPRTAKDGMMTSSNRSMAFMLSNNGYDVFLVGTRGVYGSRGHIRFNSKVNHYNDNPMHSHADIVEYDLTQPTREAFKYWNYTFDDIIAHEAPRQIDKVLEITGAEKVTYVVLSLSTQWSLALLSTNEVYAAKIHQYICMVPIINNHGANKMIKAAHELLRWLPDEVGHTLFQGFLLSQHMRDSILKLARDKRTRYTVIKGLMSLLLGSGAQYTTFLEGPVIGHFLQPVGFKQLKHYAQQVIRGRLQKFDYGPMTNMRLYSAPHPPMYDISKFGIKNWMLVSGETDMLATRASVKQILHQIGTKPYKHIYIPKYNHIDFWASFTNDVLINLPILEYLNDFQLSAYNRPIIDTGDEHGFSNRL